jgi:hypothetical protein
MYNITEEQKKVIEKGLLTAIDNGTDDEFTSQEMHLINDAFELVNNLTIPVVVGSLITANDEGKYFIVNTDQLDEIEKGSVVYLLNTYPEDIHLFTDKNGDEVWIDADDVDRKQ